MRTGADGKTEAPGIIWEPGKILATGTIGAVYVVAIIPGVASGFASGFGSAAGRAQAIAKMAENTNWKRNIWILIIW